MVRQSARTEDVESRWDNSPWAFVLAVACLAAWVLIAVAVADLSAWPPRIGLAALTAYCFWRLDKSIRKGRQSDPSERES